MKQPAMPKRPRFKPIKALEPYAEGRKAFQRDQPDTANPYGSEMFEHELWLDGWSAAAKASFKPVGAESLKQIENEGPQ